MGDRVSRVICTLLGHSPSSREVSGVPRVVKRVGLEAVKSGALDISRSAGEKAALPRVIPPQLSQSVEKAPSGPQWLHEMKLDGSR
jgi:ATP-dependent DNA ligase